MTLVASSVARPAVPSPLVHDVCLELGDVRASADTRELTEFLQQPKQAPDASDNPPMPKRGKKQQKIEEVIAGEGGWSCVPVGAAIVR